VLEALEHMGVDRDVLVRSHELALVEFVPVAFDAYPDADDLGSYREVLANENQSQVEQGEGPSVLLHGVHLYFIDFFRFQVGNQVPRANSDEREEEQDHREYYRIGVGVVVLLKELPQPVHQEPTDHHKGQGQQGEDDGQEHCQLEGRLVIEVTPRLLTGRCFD